MGTPFDITNGWLTARTNFYPMRIRLADVVAYWPHSGMPEIITVRLRGIEEVQHLQFEAGDALALLVALDQYFAKAL